MFDFQHVCSQRCPEVKYTSYCQELFITFFIQQPKNQRIKTFPSQISGIFFLIYKGHVMFYTSGEYNPINLISIYVFCIYSSLC